MIQSKQRLHVGIVMDGNGRWATGRGLSRSQGHLAGARVVHRVVEAAPRLGIGWLTLYAFSSDNWARPQAEVDGLMDLFGSYLREESIRCAARGVRLTVLGRRDRLPLALRQAVAAAEALTRSGNVLNLRVAIDYSGRDAIRRAAHRLVEQESGEVDLEQFGVLVAAADHGGPVPPADIIVRTGGERRLSDFLVWEGAYAELFFVETRWPEFTVRELAAIVAAFGRRERRFGRVASEPSLRVSPARWFRGPRIPRAR